MHTAETGRSQAGLTLADVEALFAAPFSDLLFRAHAIHRAHFDPSAIQLSTLMNIKSGGCPEDCAYCPQSVRYGTGVVPTRPSSPQDVRACAARAQANGATRFCMGAAWRSPKDRDIEHVATLIREVKALGMEACVTLGMLTKAQAERLKAAGLDYYNHNLDTSEAFYGSIISTRKYQDRLATLAQVRAAGIKVCCGGIVGMGESLRDRAALLHTLATLPEPPESVPINMLVRVAGTPLASAAPVDPLDLVRTIAVARILMPQSYVRLSAGRTDLSDAEQALCFFAGANSIFYGEELLTTPNPDSAADRRLFEKLGLRPALHPNAP
jgi:biotin synthase